MATVKIGVGQAEMAKALKRISIGAVSTKSGNEQATKLLLRATKGSTKLELLATDRTVMVRSRLALTESPATDFSFALELAPFSTLVSNLDTGSLVFEYDPEVEYLRFKGSGAKINLITIPTSNFRTFDDELTTAKKVGEFNTKDMAVGLEYASLFLSWSDDKDSKDSDSQILWVKDKEFVAGPGKVMGVFRCDHIPVEFKTYLNGVQAFLKYLRELSSEKCELYQFEEVFYFVKPKEEAGEVLMFSQSPRNPPLDSSPGEILKIFESKEVFKIDRDSLQRAISRIKVVLGESQVISLSLRGKGNRAKLTISGEDNKRERSEVALEVVRGVPTGVQPGAPAAEGSPPPPPQVTLDLNAELKDQDFKINYTLLSALMKLNQNAVLTVGLCSENCALNISEMDGRYSHNALLGWIAQ